MANLPSLVFVPGSWHRPECYSKIMKILEEQHHFECISVRLPSTKGNPDATFKDDVDVVRAAIVHETSQGRDVAVIAHSYGGMLGNSAIKGLTRSPDTTSIKAIQSPSSGTSSQSIPTSSTGHVIGLILIASGFTLSGLSFMDPLFGIPPPAWRVNKDTGFAELVKSPRELFYHDLSQEEAGYWVSKLTPQSLKSLFEGGEYAYAGWQDVPTWYIGTIEDRGLPVVIQRMQVGMARGMGGIVEHRELQTSHSPFLSQPDRVVEIISEAIQAFTGKPIEGSGEQKRLHRAISIPSFQLWRPYSWIRFGVPLGFGNAIGRSFSFFGWARGLFRSRSR